MIYQSQIGFEKNTEHTALSTGHTATNKFTKTVGG